MPGIVRPFLLRPQTFRGALLAAPLVLPWPAPLNVRKRFAHSNQEGDMYEQKFPVSTDFVIEFRPFLGFAK